MEGFKNLFKQLQVRWMIVNFQQKKDIRQSELENEKNQKLIDSLKKKVLIKKFLKLFLHLK